jgi:hypothetical protein
MVWCMSIIGKTELVQDGMKSMFMGPAGCGKTRSLLSETLRNYAPLKDIPIYAVDSHGDIATAIKLNIDNHPQWHLERIQFVKSLTDLPKDMSQMVLMIDDGRGYYSMVEHEDHFVSEPRRVFCTIQISRAMGDL